MKCRIIRQRLVEYVEDCLPPGERADIEAHLATCAACRAEAVALQRAENALRRLSVIEPAPSAADALRRLPAPRPGWRAQWVWAGVGLTAVAVLLALLVWPHAAQREPSASSSANVAMKTEPTAPSRPDQVPEVAPPALPPAPTVVVERRHPARPSPTPRRIVERPKPAPSVAPQPPAPEIVPHEPEVPAPVVTAQESEAPAGLILLIGEPRESPPSSSYHVEISFPDGERSVVERSVERNADNQPQAIRIAYERSGPETPRPQPGG